MWALIVFMIVAMSILDPIKSKRVPRFVEEYVKDRNGTQAAIRAGYSANVDTACTTAVRLLADPRVQALIDEKMAEVSREAVVDAAFVLREWIALATADPSKIAQVRRVNCRYCWGIGNRYQWGAREYAEECDNAINKQQPPPDCFGGFGWRRNGEPCPTCPECCGEGVEDIFFADTESLTGNERKLISSIKRTRDGLEIKMRDQDAAVTNLAKYLGMLLERRELTGKNGAPLLQKDIPAILPTDPLELGALYTTLMGG